MIPCFDAITAYLYTLSQDSMSARHLDGVYRYVLFLSLFSIGEIRVCLMLSLFADYEHYYV